MPKRVRRVRDSLQLAGLSLSYTVSVLENFGVSGAQSTVPNWVQKAGLEPRAGRDRAKIVLDEPVVEVNHERLAVSLTVCRDGGLDRSSPACSCSRKHAARRYRSNVLSKKINRRTKPFNNTVSHTDLKTAENWLHALAGGLTRLI